MRTGEACALTWDNIGFKKRIISIEHDVYSKVKDEKGRWYISTPKTKKGIRTVYICDTLLIALKNYKNKQEEFKKMYGKDYHYYHVENVTNIFNKVVEQRIVEVSKKKKESIINLIFTKEDGTFIGTDIIRYPYKVIHKELGIKNCRFYDLRGSFATISLRNGIKIRGIADILGHSNVETTENYYISSSDETLKSAIKNFENNVQSDVINSIIKYK